MKVLSNFVKFGLGYPQAGNTINRQMKAAKKATVFNTIGATFLTGTTLFEITQKETAFATASSLGILACISSLSHPLDVIRNIKPQYKEVIARAKQIYNK